ncbi:hypothetical protein TNCV_1075851 [Trichonephila clavipes]|uniref:Uncharacterized protein n=1 Tax=Trichonephila clavipes TaxID=2585209 RepID=A0A8X6SUW9_TRICX|nr:hypothetical protein TNCV_1075851 [Trichonephila clavipes]
MYIIGPEDGISTKKNGPAISDVVVPYYTMIFSETRDNGCIGKGFCVAHILQLYVASDHANRNEIHQTRECFIEPSIIPFHLCPKLQCKCDSRIPSSVNSNFCT